MEEYDTCSNEMFPGTYKRSHASSFAHVVLMDIPGYALFMGRLNEAE